MALVAQLSKYTVVRKAELYKHQKGELYFSKVI